MHYKTVNHPQKWSSRAPLRTPCLTGILISLHIYGQKRRGWRSGLARSARSMGRVIKSWLCSSISYFLLSHDRDTHADRIYRFSFVHSICIWFRNRMIVNSMFAGLVSNSLVQLQRLEFMPLALMSWVWIRWFDVLCVLVSTWSTAN